MSLEADCLYLIKHVLVCVYVHMYMFPKEHFGTYEAFMYGLFVKEMIHLADFYFLSLSLRAEHRPLWAVFSHTQAPYPPSSGVRFQESPATWDGDRPYPPPAHGFFFFRFCLTRGMVSTATDGGSLSRPTTPGPPLRRVASASCRTT